MASLDTSRVRTGSSPLAGGKAGKGLFAARDFDEAEVLFTIEDPIVAILDSGSLQSCCYECFRQDQPNVAPLKACLGCKSVYFCNQSCQKKSWNRVHKHECKWLKEYSPRVPPTVSRAAAQIFLRRQHGLLSDADFASIFAMRDHKEDSLKLRGQQMAEDYAVISNGIKHIARLAAPVEQISELFYKITINAQSTTNEDFAPIGICIDPRYALLNHSCDPSAFASFNGRELSVITFRPIKKDEEILVSYIDWTSPYGVRQQRLETHYFFKCNCSKCALGPKHYVDKFLCSKCEAPEAVLGKKNSLGCVKCGHINYEVSSDLANLELESASEAETLGKVDPADSGDKFLALGKRLLDTKVWPLHHQPMPAIIRGLESHYMEKDPSAALYYTLTNSFLAGDLYQPRFSPLRLQAHHHNLIVLTSLTKDDLSPLLGPRYASPTRVAELTTNLYQICAEDEEKASAPGAKRVQLARQLLNRAMQDAPEGFKFDWTKDMMWTMRDNAKAEVKRRFR